MTALNVARPVTAEAVTGRYTTDAESTTTRTDATTAYPEWMTWDDVTLDPNPALAVELAGMPCDWCGYLDHLASYRVHGEIWPVALDVCPACVQAAVRSAAEDGRVTVETIH